MLVWDIPIDPCDESDETLQPRAITKDRDERARIGVRSVLREARILAVSRVW